MGTPTGGWSEGLSHTVDLMTTCLDAAGATYPASRRGHALLPMEGRSLLPDLRGEAVGGHDVVGWSHEGHNALRVGDWKLVFSENEDAELFDFATDRTEAHDLAAERPDKLAEMRAAFDRWAKRTGVIPFGELPVIAAQREEAS